MRLLLAAALSAGSLAAAPVTDPLAFFESEIRPVLASACQECHGPERQQSGLRVDHRDGLRRGGKRGPALIPGNPDGSLLLQAVSGTHPELRMPKQGSPLTPAAIAALRTWIAMGAPDPRDRPSQGNAGDWPAAFALRRRAWFWQPLTSVDPPAMQGVAHPVDRFLRAAQEKSGITPAGRTDAAAFARRLAFILTGLPPRTGAGEPDPFSDAAVDALLASPAFGERWARHWMDWLRYAESHGSEGDPAIPHAWTYRDYLIRALNDDVPFWQLLREHIAGDLIQPRLSRDGRLNEAAIGTAHLRMVFHGFTPTDAVDEFITFTDNQVDVVSKAFLGLTVSCARCHNHKFDAISQDDYTALFGVFANAQPATVDVRAPGTDAETRAGLAALQPRIDAALRADFSAALDGLPSRLAAWQPKNDAERRAAEAGGLGPLAAWIALRDTPTDRFAAAWKESARAAEAWRKARSEWVTLTAADGRPCWRGGAGSLTWKGDGPGLVAPEPDASFALTESGDRLVGGLQPAGWASARWTDRDRGVLASSPFRTTGGRLWILAAGRNAGLRFTVAHYPRSGLIYPKSALDTDEPRWFAFDLDYWKGENVHIEAWTGPDAPVETSGGDRHRFTILEVAADVPAGRVPPPPGAPLAALLPESTPPPHDAASLAAAHVRTLAHILTTPSPSPEQRAFLDAFVRTGLLPAAAADLPRAAPLIAEYRNLAARLSAPVRAPGVREGGPGDWPLLARGDHRRPGAPVPRRFLSALDPSPFGSEGSGRRQLADRLTGAARPLVSRVIVNRLWHHVFGRGLVATPDNFGALGEPPSHPELLDWLAAEFDRRGGSIKSMLRLLVTSEAFRAAAVPSADAAVRDPDNRLLSHWSLRRLEAEAIRDAMLSLTGRLEPGGSGPGSDGTAPRRSVFVRTIRNAPDPFLAAFDAPVPATTVGRRDATNVPAQALALMNAPLVRGWARDWSAATVATAGPDPAAQVKQLHRDAFGREAAPDEVERALAWLEETGNASRRAAEETEERRAALARLADERDRLTAPAAARLRQPAIAVADAPKPLAEWRFEPGESPALPLTLHGAARIEGGALVLDGRDAWASTGPLPFTLRARTLEAWVTLTDLDQAGGGVFTVQDLPGNVFDAIVFGEQEPRRWLAGSNFFARTQSFDSPAETEAARRTVHIAVTWAEDGTVALYRNGQPSGRPYQSKGPVTFASGQSRIQFGCRHGEPTGNRLLRGAIHRARLHDRALTKDEIARSAALEPMEPSPEAVLAALTPPERERYAQLGEAMAALEEKLAADTAAEPSSPLAELALALMNAKEFLWLR